MPLKPPVAKRLWQIQRGQVEGSEQERAKAGQVTKFFFNKNDPETPQDWLNEHVYKPNSGLGGNHEIV